MRLSMITALPLLLAAASAQYVKVPQVPDAARGVAETRHYVEPRSSNSSVWPYGPLSTKGRDIINARGDVITWAGVNWPMSLETMVPEGLEWTSAEEILEKVASVGFNFIRM